MIDWEEGLRERNQREWAAAMRATDHNRRIARGCACWVCIGRLQASVVQAYCRRMGDAHAQATQDSEG